MRRKRRVCEGGGFSVEKPPPSRSLSKRRVRRGTLGGEAASLREAPLPPDPSLPKSSWRLAGYVSSELVPPESGRGFLLLSYGRGGSVSRRDHNPKTRKRARVSWAHKPKGKRKPIPSRSSGEGVWGRGASLREAPLPQNLLTPPSPLRPLRAMRRRRRKRCTSGRRLGRGSGQG